MPVILINPNSTAAMTQSALAAARGAAPGTEFDAWTSHAGPPAIQGDADGRAAVPPLLDLVARADAQGADAIVILCFDDTGLAEARQSARCPVLGIGQAAYTMASLMADRFSVVTTLDVSLPVLQANIDAQGYAERVSSLRACGVPVLDLEHHPDAVLDRVATAIRAAVAVDPGPVILGCSGMVNVAPALRILTGLTLIDGVTAAARLVEAQAIFAPRGVAASMP
ncbi:MAG: aspartate/glutamate racemase family protein [Rhodobacteraceae bacterium]|nr:aspartate/glutamate racemase family protein [Paracoccaceae bacterium]